MQHSEVAAKLAIEGVVAFLGGNVQGQLGITPRVLSTAERKELGMMDIGDTLFYPVGDSGVFFHADGPFTTIWYGGADCQSALGVLHATVRARYPAANHSTDLPHPIERNFCQRSYDIQLPNGRLAVVDAIYPVGPVPNPKFMVRVTAFNRQR